MESLGTRLLKRVGQTDLVGFKNSDQITKSASESVLGASSVPNCRTSVPNCRTPEVVTFTNAVGMLKEARDRVYQRIVAQKLMERVNGRGESDSTQGTKSATVRKTCDTSGSSQEASVDLSPLVKRSLAMMQAASAVSTTSPTAAPIPSVSDGSAEHGEPVYAAGGTADARSGASGERSWWSGDGWSDRYSWDRSRRSPGHTRSRDARNSRAQGYELH